MIFENAFFTEMLLPFLLIFVVMFAILEKSKILGENKSRNDVLVALAISLILIGFPQPRDIVVALMPWLAVGVSVILVFMILYGFVAGDLSKASLWMRITFGVLSGVFTLGVVLYVTGLGNFLVDWFSNSISGDFFMSVVLIIIIVVAVILVLVGSDKNLSRGTSSKNKSH